MAKTYLSTVKYVIKTDFTIDGIVDKHDIIGAIFGQSEGLIGEEMDLKELQKNGKLGRIEVETKTKSGKTVGTVTVPSSLDRVQTSILAAAIESVDKVGPCISKFETKTIEDARQEKRKAVTDRAKELLQKMGVEMPETQELTEQIRGDVRTSGIKEIGRERIAIGPEVDSSDELILVEGRADVLNLVRHGIKNVAGVGGAKTSRTVENLARGKKVTLFVDGDRGGDLIARQLGKFLKVDAVARAPDGKEVEELTLKEILSSLRKKGESEDTGPRPQYRDTRGFRPRNDFRKRDSFKRDRRPPQRGYERSRGPPQRREPRYERPPMPIKPNDLGEFSQHMKELEGSLKARILDKDQKPVKEVDVRDLLKEIEKSKGAEAIVLDGIITKRLLEEAEKSNVKQLVGVKKGKIEETGKVKVSSLY
jgi:DNA primase